MTVIVEKITIYSENGDSDHPNQMEITLDGSQPECPITFWNEGKPMFSMGCDEIAEFCEQLSKLNPEN